MKTNLNHHILHRTGGVWSYFEGDRADAEAECDRRNATDAGGTTVVHAGFRFAEDAAAEFYRLNV